MAEQTREELLEQLRILDASGPARPGNNSAGARPAVTAQQPATVAVDQANNQKTGQGGGLDFGLGGLQRVIDRFVKIIEEATNGIDKQLKKLTGFGFTDVGNVAAGAASAKSLDDPSKTFNVALTSLTSLFSKLGTATKGLVDVLEDAGQRSYNAYKLGGVGQGDSFKANADAQAAGFKNEKAMLEFLKNDQTRKTLAGSGTTFDQSLQKFTDFSAKVSEKLQPEINRGVIKREEIPGIAAIVAAGKNYNLDNATDREKLAQATADYVQQLERASNAYGLNRDAVLKANQANNETADEQLRQQMVGSDAQREQMRKNRALAEGMGESFQNAMSKIYAGQRLTAQDQAILQMGTGGQQGQLQAAIRETKRTAGFEKDDPIRIKAERDLEKQLANANRYQSSQRFAEITANTADPLLEAAGKDLQLANMRKAAQDKASQGGKLSPYESQQAVERAAALPQNGYRLDRDGGVTKNTGAEIANALAPVQDAYARNTIALNQEITKQITALGANTKALDTFKNILTAPLGGTNQSVSDRVKSNQETVDIILKLVKDGLVNKLDAEGKPATTPAAPGGDRSQNPVAATPASTTTPAGVGGNRSQNPVQVNRAHGTLGETGSPVEKKDVVAQLHAGERVLSTDEVSKIAGLVGVTKETTIDPREVDKNVGTVKPVEKAVNNFNTMYDAVFKGTFDGNMSANSGKLSGQPLVNAPAITPVAVTPPKAEAPVITPVTVAMPAITPVAVTPPKAEAPVITPVAVTPPKAEAPVITPVTVAMPAITPVAVTPPKAEAPVITPVAVTPPKAEAPVITPVTVKVAAAEKIDSRNIFQKAMDDIANFNKQNTDQYNAKQAADAAANSPAGMAAAKAKLTPSQLKWLGDGVPSPEILQRMPAPLSTEKAPVPETIKAPVTTIPDVKALSVSKTFDIGTFFSNMFGKLDTSNKILATNDSTNKEPTKQNTNQSFSISSIFDSISSRISPLKPAVTNTATDKGISIVEKLPIGETSRSATDGSNNKKLVDSISSTLTTITGGGSTTTKRVQSDDSKSAEKELSAAKEQFQIEKQALREKIKEQLGPNASLGDMTKAAMSSDEGKNIFNKYNEKFTTLSKQIGAGISYQTNFEPDIARSQLVVQQSPSLSLAEGMKGYNSILDEATVDEGNKEPKEINLNDAEPGSKDLHDQLIQLNTTMRQLVEHSADSLDKADALRRTTSSLSGNRFA